MCNVCFLKIHLAEESHCWHTLCKFLAPASLCSYCHNPFWSLPSPGPYRELPGSLFDYRDSSSPVVPNLFGPRDRFHRRQFFHGLGQEGWFQDNSNALHFLCMLFLLLSCELHLGSSGIRYQRLGTPTLEKKVMQIKERWMNGCHRVGEFFFSELLFP